jgi:hypothetical protein
MHFKPAWDHEAVHTGDLTKGLQARMPIVSAYKSSFQFPYGVLTYGYATWAIESVLAFSAEFSALIAVADRLSGSDPLP